MSRAQDRAGTKSIARKARRTPRYRYATLRKAFRELGRMSEMPRKIAEAVQEDNKAPEGIGKK